MTWRVWHHWPRVMRTARFWGLMFAAEMCASRGTAISFVPAIQETPPPGLASLGDWWIDVYGVVWIGAAVLCVVLAVNEKRWRWAIPLVAAPAFVWFLAYGTTWAITHDTSWSGALYFQAISGMIFWAAATAPPGGWRA